MKQLLKESNILLRGNSNLFDGCWNIPIAKTKLQFGNYPFPQNHSSVYKIIKVAQAMPSTKILRRHSKDSIAKVPKFLRNLNMIAEDNYINYLIEK